MGWRGGRGLNWHEEGAGGGGVEWGRHSCSILSKGSRENVV